MILAMIPNGILYREMVFYGLDSLEMAIESRDMDMLQELATRGGQMNSVSHRLVEILLDAGAKVNTRNSNRCSPLLQCAVYTGDLELVRTLLDVDGVNIDNQNRFVGATALHDAVLCCKEAMVCLSHAGASIDVKTYYEGNTALHWASTLNVGTSHAAIIARLLEFGSDVNERNKEGQTPFDLILQKCDKSTVNLCLKYNADMKKVLNRTTGETLLCTTRPTTQTKTCLN